MVPIRTCQFRISYTASYKEYGSMQSSSIGQAGVASLAGRPHNPCELWHTVQIGSMGSDAAGDLDMSQSRPQQLLDMAPHYHSPCTRKPP